MAVSQNDVKIAVAAGVVFGMATLILTQVTRNITQKGK